MKILLIGSKGQVGWELRRTLAPLGSVANLDYPEINLADADSTSGWVRRVRPEVIVNSAAYTAVDQAESDIDTAHAINAVAPGILAAEAHALGAGLIHYSTDFVFDGSKKRLTSNRTKSTRSGYMVRPSWTVKSPSSKRVPRPLHSARPGSTAHAGRVL